jgi:adenosylcobinamide-GDP ribazoletransferase
MALPDPLVDAIRFLTIMRVRDTESASAPDWLARAMKFFPLVGAGVGLASALVLLIANELWSPVVSALLAVAASIVLTSALHEDGLADAADAFGGGWTVEKRLAIMKDSRIGTYGALALGIGVALRVAAIADMPMWAGPAALIAAHAAARAMPAFAMNHLGYAGETAAMKVNYAEVAVRPDEIRFGLVVVAVAALPLALVSLKAVLVGWICGAVLAWLLAKWSRRLIGGYTGDVLGAVVQVCEIGFLLGVAGALST